MAEMLGDVAKLLSELESLKPGLQAATSELVKANGDLQASANSAREALRLATRRYEAGYSGYLEVLETQRSTNVSELLLIRNRQALLAAIVDLITALGGGWNPAQTSAAK